MRTRACRTHCVTLACLLSATGLAVPRADLPGTGRDAGRTVLYRDTWGVPHIYAPTIEAGLFAMGWAQAQDRPDELLTNMLRGMGELASVEGRAALGSDRVALMWNLYAGSRAKAGGIRPDVRRHLRAFVQGINAFYHEHPADVPAWWRRGPVDEFMVVAFSRLFLQSWSFDDGFRDLRRAGVQPVYDLVARGSNQFAVAPARTTEGAPILLSDTHLPWDGSYRFWEVRIHAGALRGSGFTLAGMPYIGLGHNEHVAWSMTTGGPDTADVYELRLDGPRPTRYLYDGTWRPLLTRKHRVTVKGGGEMAIEVLESHHGPLAAIRKGRGYAIRSSYADAVDVNAAWLDFGVATDYTGIEKGLALLQLFPHNVMVADTSGNIYYQRTGRVPRRPAGVDYSKPVDGTTSTTEWQGLHPASDLLQAINPPQGYMQNCNVPPDAMMERSPFSLDRTLPYLYSDPNEPATYGRTSRGGWTNPRGARMVDLLKREQRMTVERAMAIANDLEPFGARRWVELLMEADRRFGAAHRSSADYAAGIRELRSWNRELAATSTAALKYACWRDQLVEDLGHTRLRSLADRVVFLREPLGETRPAVVPTDAELQQAAASFARAMDRLRATFGSIDKAYGDVFRVGRGTRSWPSEGGMAADRDLTTLRSVGYGPERPDHTRWARSGQTSTGIVVLTRPVRSWTCVPLGQSDRPASPHFSDQAERLFSPRTMKASWWTPDGLAGHVESRTVLAGPR